MHYNVYTNLKGDIPMNKEFYEINSAEYEEAIEILCEIAEEDEDEEEKDKNNTCENSVLFSRKAVNAALQNKLVKHYSKNVSRNTGTDITDLEKRLNLLKP